MYLHKRGNIYWSEFTRNGKRYQFSTGKKSKPEARDFVEKMMAVAAAPDFERAVQIARALFADTARPQIKLADAWTKYETTATALGRNKLSATSYRKRKNALANFVKWTETNHPNIRHTDQVTATLASEYAQALATLGRTPKTRINILGDLGAIWNVLEKVSDDIHNPWKNLNPKNLGGKRLEAFTPDQERAILAAAKRIGKDWYPVCMILRHTGLRYHDVAQLKWSEIKGLDGTGEQARQHSGGAVVRVTPKKTTRHGITVAVPLIEEACQALRDIRDDGRKGEYCFPVHARNWGRHGGLERVLNFSEVLAAAGIAGKGYTVHCWRHTAATRLAESGAPLDVRKRLLGHREDDTAARYDHAEHLEESRAAIERAARG